MFTEDRPYGYMPEIESRSMWSFNGEGETSTDVGFDSFEALREGSYPVRVSSRVQHAISCDQIEDEELEDDTCIDIEARRSRMIVQPMLSKLRSRHAGEDIDPDNVVEVEQEEIDSTLEAIDGLASEFKTLLLQGAAARLMAFDVAAGQTEAIIRDCFDTDIQIDDEIVPYIECISNMDLMAATLKQCKNIPEIVWHDALREYLAASLHEIRTDHNQDVKSQKRIDRVKRFKSEYEEMVAKVGGSTLGTTRGFSDRKHDG